MQSTHLTCTNCCHLEQYRSKPFNKYAVRLRPVSGTPEKQRETKLRHTCIVLQSWYLREIPGTKVRRIHIVLQSYRMVRNPTASTRFMDMQIIRDITSVVTRFA